MSEKIKARPKTEISALPLILTGAGLILVAIAVAIFAPRENLAGKLEGNTGPAPGIVSYPAPDVQLVDLAGVTVSLHALQGQVVMVNNWATWCPPCRAEMPELETFYQTHKDDGFILIGINSGDQSSQVREFIQEYQLSFPIWLDPTGLALHAFRNNALPSSYILDRTGTVRLVWTGAVSLEALETYVTPMLED